MVEKNEALVDQAESVAAATDGQENAARHVLSFVEEGEGRICALGIGMEGSMPTDINDAMDRRPIPTGEEFVPS